MNPTTTALAAALLAGMASAQTSTPSPGVTLSDPLATTDAMLYDSLGQPVHSWAFTAEPAAATYLDDDGNVWRVYETGLKGIAVGGAIQKVAFDGTILWDYTVPTPGFQHHDIALLPNGNVLIIVQDVHTVDEAVAMGADPATVNDPFYAETIIEVEPTGPTTGDIVWQWNIVDHLIQDFDATKANFGVVADHPELADINYNADVGSPYWLHMNGIDYNPELDQILMSVRDLDELWVIDHSTTTEEAAGSTGGTSGKGGDLLYRWGNPAAYDHPGTQQYSRQHDTNWVPAGYPGAGNIICFNNKKGSLLGLGDASAVTEIVPPVDAMGNYTYVPGVAYGPAAPVWEYLAPNPTDFYSALISGAVRLPNGNTLVTAGDQDWVFEVGLNDQLVWDHTIPRTFKARRYDFALFAQPQSMSLTDGGTVELNAVTGTANAGDFYWILGTTSGTSPGFSIQGFDVPLNPIGPYFNLTSNLEGLMNNFGTLDSDGNGQATLTLPAGTNPVLAGVTAHHVVAAFDASGNIGLVSEARALTFVP